MTRWTKRRDGVVRTTIRVPVHLTLERVRQIARRTGWSETKVVRLLKKEIDLAMSCALSQRVAVLSTDGGRLTLEDGEDQRRSDDEEDGGPYGHVFGYL
jgi:hypothetical protein